MARVGEGLGLDLSQAMDALLQREECQVSKCGSNDSHAALRMYTARGLGRGGRGSHTTVGLVQLCLSPINAEVIQGAPIAAETHE